MIAKIRAICKGGGGLRTVLVPTSVLDYITCVIIDISILIRSEFGYNCVKTLNCDMILITKINVILFIIHVCIV